MPDFYIFRTFFSLFSKTPNSIESIESLTTIIIQFRRMGIENTVDMNNPLLSKYCSLENDFQYLAPNSLIVSEKNTSNTERKTRKQCHHNVSYEELFNRFASMTPKLFTYIELKTESFALVSDFVCK